MSSAKFLVGLLAGLAAGTVAALLFTDEGAKIRKSARRKGAEYVEDLKDSFDSFIDSVSNKFEGAKSDTTNKARSSWERR